MAEAYGNVISASSVTGYSGSYYRSYISATIKSESATRIVYTLRNNVYFSDYTGGWGSSTSLNGSTVVSNANVYNSSGTGWASAGTTSVDVTIDKTTSQQTLSYSSTANIQGLGTSTATVTITVDPISEFTASVNAETGGSATVNGESSVSVESGTHVTYQATANANYSFNGWYNGNTLVSSNNPYSFNISSDITLTAKFLGDAFLINTNAGTNVISTSGDGSYRYNTQCTLTCVLNTDTTQYHYVFDGWYLNNVKVSSDQTYTFTVLGGGTYEARAIRTLQTYTVTLSKNSYVSSMTGAGTYEYGQTCVVTATLLNDNARYHYSFDGWYNSDNEKISSDISYEFVVHGDVTLTAKGVRSSRYYHVSVQSIGDGTAYAITQGHGSAEVDVTYQSSVQLLAVPNADAEFIQWSDGNTQTSRSITVESDVTLQAIFTDVAGKVRVKTALGTWKNAHAKVKTNSTTWKNVLKIFVKTGSSTWKQTK